MIGGVFSAAADAKQIVVVDFLPVGDASQFQPLRPFDFNRRHREKQRSWEIALAADTRLLKRFFSGYAGQTFGEPGR
jgi:hypothetical protein